MAMLIILDGHSLKYYWTSKHTHMRLAAHTQGHLII
jgi:hypothetical protein